jgi:hypothetical protein
MGQLGLGLVDVTLQLSHLFGEFASPPRHTSILPAMRAIVRPNTGEWPRMLHSSAAVE